MAKKVRLVVYLWEDHCSNDDFSADNDIGPVFLASSGFSLVRKRSHVVVGRTISVTPDLGSDYEGKLRLLRRAVLAQVDKCPHCGGRLEFDLDELLVGALARKIKRQKRKPKNEPTEGK